MGKRINTVILYIGIFVQLFSFLLADRTDDYMLVKGDITIHNDLKGEKLILVEATTDTLTCEMYASVESTFKEVITENGAIINNLNVMEIQPKTSDSIVI